MSIALSVLHLEQLKLKGNIDKPDNLSRQVFDDTI